MNIKFIEIDYLKTSNSVSKDLIKSLTQACGGNDGCCCGGGTETGTLDEEN